MTGGDRLVHRSPRTPSFWPDRPVVVVAEVADGNVVVLLFSEERWRRS